MTLSKIFLFLLLTSTLLLVSSTRPSPSSFYIRAQTSFAEKSFVITNFQNTWTDVDEENSNFRLSGALSKSSSPDCSLLVENINVNRIDLTANIGPECRLIFNKVTVKQGLYISSDNIGDNCDLMLNEVVSDDTSLADEFRGVKFALKLDKSSNGFKNITIQNSKFVRNAQRNGDTPFGIDKSCASYTNYAFSVCIPPPVNRPCQPSSSSSSATSGQSARFVLVKDSVIENYGFTDASLNNGAIMFGQNSIATQVSQCYGLYFFNNNITSIHQSDAPKDNIGMFLDGVIAEAVRFENNIITCAGGQKTRTIFLLARDGDTIALKMTELIFKNNTLSASIAPSTAFSPSSPSIDRSVRTIYFNFGADSTGHISSLQVLNNTLLTPLSEKAAINFHVYYSADVTFDYFRVEDNFFNMTCIRGCDYARVFSNPKCNSAPRVLLRRNRIFFQYNEGTAAVVYTGDITNATEYQITDNIFHITSLSNAAESVFGFMGSGLYSNVSILNISANEFHFSSAPFLAIPIMHGTASSPDTNTIDNILISNNKIHHQIRFPARAATATPEIGVTVPCITFSAGQMESGSSIIEDNFFNISSLELTSDMYSLVRAVTIGNSGGKQTLGNLTIQRNNVQVNALVAPTVELVANEASEQVSFTISSVTIENNILNVTATQPYHKDRNAGAIRLCNGYEHASGDTLFSVNGDFVVKKNLIIDNIASNVSLVFYRVPKMGLKGDLQVVENVVRAEKNHHEWTALALVTLNRDQTKFSAFTVYFYIKTLNISSNSIEFAEDCRQKSFEFVYGLISHASYLKLFRLNIQVHQLLLNENTFIFPDDSSVGHLNDFRLVSLGTGVSLGVDTNVQIFRNTAKYKSDPNLKQKAKSEGYPQNQQQAHCYFVVFDHTTISGSLEMMNNVVHASGKWFGFGSTFIQFVPTLLRHRFKILKKTIIANNDIKAPLFRFLHLWTEAHQEFVVKNNNVIFGQFETGSFLKNESSEDEQERPRGRIAIEFFLNSFINLTLIENNKFIFDHLNPATAMLPYYLVMFENENRPCDFNENGSLIVKNNQFSILNGTGAQGALLFVEGTINNSTASVEPHSSNNNNNERKYIIDFTENYGSMTLASNFSFFQANENLNFSAISGSVNGFMRMKGNQFTITQTQFPLDTAYEGVDGTTDDPDRFFVSLAAVSSASNIEMTENLLLVQNWLNPLERKKTMPPLDFSLLCLACRPDLAENRYFENASLVLGPEDSSSLEKYIFINNTINARSYSPSLVKSTTEVSTTRFTMFTPAQDLSVQTKYKNPVFLELKENVLASSFVDRPANHYISASLLSPVLIQSLQFAVGPLPCNKFGENMQGIPPKYFVNAFFSATFVEGRRAVEAARCEPTKTRSLSVSRTFIKPPTTTSTTTTAAPNTSTTMISNMTTAPPNSTNGNETSTTATPTATFIANRTPTRTADRTPSHTRVQDKTISQTFHDPKKDPPGLSPSQVVAQESSARLVSAVAAGVAAPTAALATARGLAVFTLVACPKDQSDSISIVLGWVMSPIIAAATFIGIFFGGYVISLIYGFWLEFKRRRTQQEEDEEEETFRRYAAKIYPQQQRRRSSQQMEGEEEENNDDDDDDLLLKEEKMLKKISDKTTNRSYLEGALALSPYPSIILKILAQLLPFWGVAAGVLIGKLEVGNIILGVLPIVVVFGACGVMAWNVHKVVNSKNGPRVTQSLVYRAPSSPAIGDPIASCFLHPVGRFLIAGWFCWQSPRTKDLEMLLEQHAREQAKTKDRLSSDSERASAIVAERVLEDEIRDRQRCAAVITRFRGTLTKFWGCHSETEIEDLKREAVADLDVLNLAQPHNTNNNRNSDEFADPLLSGSSLLGRRKSLLHLNAKNNNKNKATKKSFLDLQNRLQEHVQEEESNKNKASAEAKVDDKEEAAQLRPPGCKFMGYPDFSSRTWHYRSLLSPHFFAISLVFTTLIALAQGFALAAPTQAHCRGAMRFIAALNIILCFLTLFLRPYIIPLQNIFIISLDLIVTISSIIGALWVAEGRDDLAAPVQLMCAVSSSVIGGMMVLNAATRLFCIQCLGVHVVPRVEIFRRMRKEVKRISLERMANEMMQIVTSDEREREGEQDKTNNNNRTKSTTTRTAAGVSNQSFNPKKKNNKTPELAPHTFKAFDETYEQSNNDHKHHPLLGVRAAASSGNLKRTKSSQMTSLRHHHSSSSSKLNKTSSGETHRHHNNNNQRNEKNFIKSSPSLIPDITISPTLAPYVKSPKLSPDPSSVSADNNNNNNNSRSMKSANASLTSAPSMNASMRDKKSHSSSRLTPSSAMFRARPSSSFSGEDEEMMMLPAAAIAISDSENDKKKSKNKSGKSNDNSSGHSKVERSSRKDKSKSNSHRKENSSDDAHKHLL